MIARRLVLAVALLSPLAFSACDAGQYCERVCRTGKACGDTCIDRDATCNTPPGSACNG